MTRLIVFNIRKLQLTIAINFNLAIQLASRAEHLNF